MLTSAEPVVSCILQVRNPELTVRAIRFFLRQEYENKELIVIDDGPGSCADRIPSASCIRYLRLTEPQPEAALRKLLYSQARGEIVVLWSEDTWFAPEFLLSVADGLVRSAAPMAEIDSLLFYDPHADAAYRSRKRSATQRRAVACLTSHALQNDIDGPADAASQRIVLPASEGLMVRLIASGKPPGVGPHPASDTRAILGNDLESMGRHAERPMPRRQRARRVARRLPAARPLVSAILLARDSTQATFAVDYFRRQHYSRRELIVVDATPDKVGALFAGEEGIRVLTAPESTTAGAQRNLACREATGDIFMHWDESAWHAPTHIEQIVAALQEADADLCSVSPLLACDPATMRAFVYEHPLGYGYRAACSSLAYRREVWEANPYPDAGCREDLRFVCGVSSRRSTMAPAQGCQVNIISSAQESLNPYWRRYPVQGIISLLGEDWALYEQELPSTPANHAATTPPMVSCVMPRCGDRLSTGLAAHYFLRQDYDARELIIVDDGSNPIREVIPYDGRIHYVGCYRSLSLGSRLNLACAQARGDIILYWDHSSWYAPNRVSAFAAAMLEPQAEASSPARALWLDPFARLAWSQNRPEQDSDANVSDLCWRRSFWLQHPFEEVESPNLPAVPHRDSSAITTVHDYSCQVHIGRPAGGVHDRHAEAVGYDLVARYLGGDTSFYQQDRVAGHVPNVPEEIRHILDDRRVLHDARTDAAPQGFDQPVSSQGSRTEPAPERARWAVPSNRRPTLVSCIMPTYNRRRFVPLAIQYFQRQDYEPKELIIIDDGTDPIGDLVPGDRRIRYVRLKTKLTVGAKRNLACEQARGEIIVHWDDDDWHAPERIRTLVNTLVGERAAVCGLNPALFYDLRSKHAWQYFYPPDVRFWVHGSSFCYFRAFWEQNRFCEIDVGEDNQFIWNTSAWHMAVAPEVRTLICMIHDGNVSPKAPGGGYWQPYPADEVLRTLGDDWRLYEPAAQVPAKPVADTPPKLSILICSTFAGGQRLASLLEVIGREASPAVQVLVDVSHGHKSIAARKDALLERAAGEYACFIEDENSVSTAHLAALFENLDHLGSRDDAWREAPYQRWKERNGILRRVATRSHAPGSRPVFTICHTTARRDRWRDSYDAWWGNCDDPGRVEYVLCVDRRWGFSPDELLAANGRTKIVWNNRRKCSVDGWNVAAAASSGDVLILNADDFRPPRHWDTELLKVIPDLDAEFVVEVNSSAAATARSLMILGILSRARYQRLGYALYPEYESMYSDDEFTLHARQDGIVIDARHLEFRHQHPFGGEAGWDTVYAHQNRQAAYQSGEALLSRRTAAGFPPPPDRRAGFDFDVTAIPVTSGIDVLVDVGVNRGQFARPALEYFKPRMYLGIEMLDDHVRELQADPFLHDGMSRFIVRCAVGADSAMAPVLRTNFAPSSSLLPVNPQASQWYGFDMTQSEQGTVPVESLDRLCERHGITAIDLLKIDVQGYEGRVLEGAAHILDRTGCVVIEVLHQQHYFGQSSAEEIDRRLAAHGLRFWGWLREHTSGGLRLEGDAVYLRL